MTAIPTTTTGPNARDDPPAKSSPAPRDPLLIRAKLGDAAARSELLRGLQDPWFRFCDAMLVDPDAARDATQETALRFLTALPRLRGGSTLQTWSLGIALNVCREMKRGRRRPKLVAPPPQAPSDAGLAEAEDI